MIVCQETDSKVAFTLSYESGSSGIAPLLGWRLPSKKRETATERLRLSIPIEFPNETSGEMLYGPSLAPLEVSKLVRQPWNVIGQTDNEEVMREATKLLSIIQEVIARSRQPGSDLSHLPPWWAFNVDDGSVLIEWIFNDFRIGFSIEPDVENSSWYLVSNENLGEISASGYTSKLEGKLVSWLVSFALPNS